MSKTKNPTQSVELRQSVNLSLDDVGLTRLYQELWEIEFGASGLASIQVHALKRRHLLKILHAYCADAIESTPRSTDSSSTKSTQKFSSVEKPVLTKPTQRTSLHAIETMHKEHPPTMVKPEADQALLGSGFDFQSQT